jgi:hypothetical protein
MTATSLATAIVNSDDTLGLLWSHIVLLLSGFASGATAWSILGNAVNTFPTPKNIYGAWLLGVLKYAVGQRVTGANAFRGLQSEVTAVTDSQKAALENGSVMQIVKRNGGPSSVVAVNPVPGSPEGPAGEQKGKG